jgi:hypothetical protein
VINVRNPRTCVAITSTEEHYAIRNWSESLACPGGGTGPLAIRDKLGHVVVKLGRRLVERSEPGSVCPRELRQVRVGYLAVTDDSLGGDIVAESSRRTVTVSWSSRRARKLLCVIIVCIMDGARLRRYAH